MHPCGASQEYVPRNPDDASGEHRDDDFEFNGYDEYGKNRNDVSFDIHDSKCEITGHRKREAAKEIERIVLVAALVYENPEKYAGEKKH